MKPQPGELRSDQVDYGSDVKLTVPIHAIPAPKMVWYVEIFLGLMDKENIFQTILFHFEYSYFYFELKKFDKINTFWITYY